jgi:hypothetical protein
VSPLFDPEADTHLWDAVFGEIDPSMHWATRRRIQSVRELFVDELKWTRQMLERYRFRMVAHIANQRGEILTVQLKAPSDYAIEAPRRLLELLLEEMTHLPLAQAQQHFRETLIPVKEIKHVMRNYRITLSDEDYAFIKQAALIRGIEIPARDVTSGNPDLSQAISELLRMAYGGAVEVLK